MFVQVCGNFPFFSSLSVRPFLVDLIITQIITAWFVFVSLVVSELSIDAIFRVLPRNYTVNGFIMTGSRKFRVPKEVMFGNNHF